jgi:predicted nucleic acid-binding protein
MLVLADTNVLLRLLAPSDPQHATVRGAIRALRTNGDRLVTAPQIVAEFWNVCTRPAAARGGFGLDVSETDRRLRIIERICPILPDHSGAYAVWRSLVVTHAVCGVQVHDARLAAFMLAHGITHILTFNARDFARYGVTPLDPASTVPPISPPTVPPTP